MIRITLNERAQATGMLTAWLSCHQFVAVASRDLSRAQQFADRFKFKRAYGSYDEVTGDKDVEVVYIGTLPVNHVELSMKMLEAGKHVLCEKPMAMNYKQAKMVLDFAKSKKLLFLEGIWSRFFPVYDAIRQEIASDSVGDIKLVQASLCFPVFNKSDVKLEKVKDVKLGRGGAIEAGIYPVQFACLVFNEMPETITAVGNIMEGGYDENACIILKYKNGAVANLTYHLSVENNNNDVICGTKGMIEIDHCTSPVRITAPSGVKEFRLTSEGYNFGTLVNIAGLQYEAKAVRECILKGKTEHEFMTHADSEMVHKILDEVRRQIGMIYPDFD